MNKNNIIICFTITAIVLIILIPTVYNIVKTHNDRLIRVTEKRIEEAARDCYLKEVCKENKITLKELYDNNFLSQESNPISKEYYNENSYVLVKNKTYKFVEVK